MVLIRHGFNGGCGITGCSNGSDFGARSDDGVDSCGAESDGGCGGGSSTGCGNAGVDCGAGILCGDGGAGGVSGIGCGDDGCDTRYDDGGGDDCGGGSIESGVEA